MVDDKLGFKCMQILMEASDVNELNECMRVVNNGYRILLEQLETYDEIMVAAKNLGLKVGFVELKNKGD